MLGNREIKFRAWHGGHKYAEPEMLYDEKPGDCLVYRNQGQNIVAVMQYTGLKDKNGKEIYEGDLFEGWKGIYVVAWLPFDAGLYLVEYHEWKEYITGGESPVDVDTLNGKRYEFLSMMGTGEVIGNIYEHPHLLKEAESNVQA